ncbi:hypothetical protein AUC69_06600 [Methyloceanibacter superfactus]|uniref:Uncharacterized protein n=1 Tax=Methyloceanibacter superfactus TaxID=1774969 RepID=A0A1E3W7N5_9HYPH|nr:hypothetical protein AUC69_06600 [Methyloceanibacter superfactus]
MNEHHMHLRGRRLAGSGTAAWPMAASRRPMSASSCAAVKASRTRAVPCGTVGGLMAVAQNPASRSAALKHSAASAVPTMSGTICVAEAPVS